MKYFEVQFTDGVYRIPAYVVARVRADYYAKLDTERGDASNYDEAYQSEYTYTMSSNDELLDWIGNNTNWEDVEQFASKVSTPPIVPHKKQWLNADIKIVEIESDHDAA